MSSDAPNTKHVQIPFEVPRNPSAYRATDHIQQRLNYRIPDDIQDRVVRESIERGYCRGTTPPSGPDTEGVQQCFAFERWIEGREWRVVVGLRGEAFVGEQKHLAITVMEVDG